MRLIIHNAWTALALSPAFALRITLICYQLGCCLQRYARGNPLCNPGSVRDRLSHRPAAPDRN